MPRRSTTCHKEPPMLWFAQLRIEGTARSSLRTLLAQEITPKVISSFETLGINSHRPLLDGTSVNVIQYRDSSRE